MSRKKNSEMGTLMYAPFCHAKDVYSEIHSGILISDYDVQILFKIKLVTILLL